MSQIVLAILIGGLFGFVLHRAGASNPQKIIGMLRLTDFHLAKVILFAIGISSLILFALMYFGIIGNEHLSIKTSHWGVAIGGLIFGLGFAIAGYCPGTGLCALGEGRKDAKWFVVGGLFGALLFMFIFSYVLDSSLLNDLFGGNTTFANTGVSGTHSIVNTISGVFVAGIIAIIFITIAILLPNKK
jgi:uncharacterized membrane protein YedE/YeeE